MEYPEWDRGRLLSLCDCRSTPDCRGRKKPAIVLLPWKSDGNPFMTQFQPLIIVNSGGFSGEIRVDWGRNMAFNCHPYANAHPTHLALAFFKVQIFRLPNCAARAARLTSSSILRNDPDRLSSTLALFSLRCEYIIGGGGINWQLEVLWICPWIRLRIWIL